MNIEVNFSKQIRDWLAPVPNLLKGNNVKKISVVIPSYNRAGTIQRAVESVLAQTHEVDEIIIVDDGSTDETYSVLQKIKNNKIKWKPLEQNQGVSNARNIGVLEASNSIIAFQDSDDCWRPDKLEKQLEYWEVHPEYDMLYSSYLHHLEDGGTIRVPSETMSGKLEGDLFEDLLLRNSVGAPTILVKKECFLSVGGFETTLKSLEDWDYAIRFSKDHLIGYADIESVDTYATGSGVSSNTGAYYDSRCRMVARYKKELIERDLFNQVVGDIFARAQESQLLETVKKLLLLYLQ